MGAVYLHMLASHRPPIESSANCGKRLHGVTMSVDKGTQDIITLFGWEQVDHPPFSPKLAPSDYHNSCNWRSIWMVFTTTTIMKSRGPWFGTHCNTVVLNLPLYLLTNAIKGFAEFYFLISDFSILVFDSNFVYGICSAWL